MSGAWYGGIRGTNQTIWANNATLRSAISDAMGWWFDHDFTNTACLDGGGWSQCPCDTPGLWNQNWFSNVRVKSVTIFLSSLFLMLWVVGYPHTGIRRANMSSSQRHIVSKRIRGLQPNDPSVIRHLRSREELGSRCQHSRHCQDRTRPRSAPPKRERSEGCISTNTR